MNFDHSRRRQIDERPCLEGQEAPVLRVEALHAGIASECLTACLTRLCQLSDNFFNQWFLILFPSSSGTDVWHMDSGWMSASQG
jgi:hypothetical protein